jgi:Cof subfamily protein (haloacid dehalogenase superfamily)
MGKFDGILICTDLDGTLYKKDKTISKKNRDAIEYFKREGGSFTFITGRMPYYSRDAYDKVKPNVAFGCVNGGALYDGEAMRYTWAMELPLDALKLVGVIYEKFPGVGIQLCCPETTYFAKNNASTERFRRLTGLPNNVCDHRDFNKTMGKIIFSTDIEEELLGVAETLRSHELAEKFDFIRSERTLFEILPKGVNKGLALKKLADQLGIDIKRTVAIGDYDNDAAMLKAAGVGIAVANASKAAIDAADAVTVSNEDDAIAKVIYDIEDGKYL